MPLSTLPLLLLAATTPAGALDHCTREIRSYDARIKPVYDIALKRLTMFGAEHSRDPATAQVAAIEQRFTAFKPTLVLYEGPDRGIASTTAETVSTRGESGLLRYLAKQAGVPARSLEPSPVEQVAALRGAFTGDQIMLFFALREATRLRDREGKTGAAMDAAMSVLLEKMAGLSSAAKLKTSIRDLPTLAAATERAWPGQSWQTVPPVWFSPMPNGVGQFTNAINAADSDFRNRHLLALIDSALAGGYRIMIVIGRDHVTRLSQAAHCIADRHRR